MLPSHQDRSSFESIRSWVQVNFGISFPDDKLDSLSRRLDDVCERARIPDLATLHRQLVTTSSSEVHFLVSQAVATNHTFFFREPEVLDELDRRVLGSAPHATLRIWSAACSTGEEPYTVAMMAAETFGISSLSNRMALLATDISAAALSTAEAGLYRAPRVTSVPDAMRARYFETTSQSEYSVSDALRKVCTFRRLNLAAASWPFRQQFHAILCRNVLYYFEPELRRRVVTRMYEHTLPGGWMFTSVTETIRALDIPWTFVRPGVYRKDAS